MKLDVLSSVTEPDWDKDLVRLNGTCLHSYKWSLYSAENSSAMPLYFRLRDQNNQVAAISFGLYREKKVGIKIHSSLSFGSLPASDAIENIHHMAGELLKYCREKNIAVLSMNSFGTPYGSEVLSELGFSVSRRWEFILNLQMTEAELFQKFHSKKRNLIRKAEKSGLRVITSSDLDFLLKYRELAMETLARKKSQGIDFPEAISENQIRYIKKKLIDTGIGKLYLAFQNENVVAGAFFVAAHLNVYYMLSASNEAGLKTAAPDLILWTAIKEYQKEGYRVFNFGGLSESELNGEPLENSGLYHFKKRFSPEIVPCLKGEVVLRPYTHKLYQLLVKTKNRSTQSLKDLLNKIANRAKRFFNEFYRVPYCVPAWGVSEHMAIFRCLFSGKVIDGPHKETLYNLASEKTGQRYVFGYNSGREAICAILKAGRTGEGDLVIMPSYCCETVVQAVVATGAKPLFCDIGEDFNPDVNHILELIRPEVKAIIFPHMFGKPGRIDILEEELEKRKIRSNILLIDDAAQSFGARLNGRLVGTFGDAGIISFGPGKTMTATGGGLAITNSEILANHLKEISSNKPEIKTKLKKIIYWVVFRRWRRYTLPLYPFVSKWLSSGIEIDSITTLTNIDAAIAIQQIKRLDELIFVRVKRKQIIDDVLEIEMDRIGHKQNDVGMTSQNILNVYTKYTLTLPRSEGNIRDLYQQYMGKSGVEIQHLYTPIHLTNTYEALEVPLPMTEKLWNKALHVPVEPSISERMFRYVVKQLSDFLNRSSEKVHAAP